MKKVVYFYLLVLVNFLNSKQIFSDNCVTCVTIGNNGLATNFYKQCSASGTPVCSCENSKCPNCVHSVALHRTKFKKEG